LFFSSDEQDLLAALGDSLESVCSLVDLSYSLVEVDDMNTVALHEDIRSHCGIPLALQVAESGNLPEVTGQMMFLTLSLSFLIVYFLFEFLMLFRISRQ
jgi:hypothetical protein